MKARPTLGDYARGIAGAAAAQLLVALVFGGLIVACGEVLA